jgi:uncharacterized protein with PIN domain
MECNGVIAEVPKTEVMERLLPKTRQYFQKYKKCPDCDRIYWEGSHFEKMKKNIEKIIINIK